MAMKRVDGFCLWNIDVPLPIANSILALLITCLVMINDWMDLTSHAIERFVSSVSNTMNLLSRVAENAAGRREQLHGSRPSNVDQPATTVVNQEPWSLDDTEAQVIMPESLSDTGKPNRYVLVLDCSSKPFKRGKTPIINISASTDVELFQALRVWQGLKSRSLTGAVGTFLWPRSVQLELNFVWSDLLLDRRQVDRWFDYYGLYVSEGGFEEHLPELRPQWIDSDEQIPISKAELDDAYNYPERCGTKNDELLRFLAWRSLPLHTSDLLPEHYERPIPVLILRRPFDRTKFLLTVMIMVLIILIPVTILTELILDDPGSRIVGSSFLTVLNTAMVKLLLEEMSSSRKLSTRERIFNIVLLGTHCIGTLFMFEIYIIWLAMFIISVDVIISLSGARFNNRRLIHGFRRTIFLCSCGHSIATERSTTEIDQATIRVLYELGIHRLSEGPEPLLLIEEWARDLSTNSSTPFSSQPEQLSADEISEDIADQPTGTSSGLQAREYGQPSVVNRRRSNHQRNDAIRFMYICYPSSNGRCLSELTVRTKDDRPTDRVLIEGLKREYNSLRPYYVRLRTLRDFSTIRLARFNYYSTTSSKAPKAVDWKWPDPAKCDWETTGGPDEPIDDTGLAQLMLHLWVEECRTRNKKATASEEEKEGWLTRLSMKFMDETRTIPIHTSNAPPPLGLRYWPRHITLFLSHLKAPSPGKGKEPNTNKPMRLDITRISLELDYGTRLADPLTIYYHAPKKLHTGLRPDPTGRNPPIGWAIWIEEDFSVPWYMVLVLILIIIATCIFASFYGWPIGSYIIAATGLVMTGWVLRAKDSKHPRLN